MNMFDFAGDDYIVFNGVVYMIKGEERVKAIEEFIEKYYKNIDTKE